jgi:putative addiction module component (TIGR02574 family)
MAATSSKVLSEAMKLPADERVRVAEKLLESADAEGFEEDSDAAIQKAWADEIQRRSRELTDGSVRGLTVDEARRLVASDPADDDR